MLITSVLIFRSVSSLKDQHRYARRCLVLLMRFYANPDRMYSLEDNERINGRLLRFLHAGVITAGSFSRLRKIANHGG